MFFNFDYRKIVIGLAALSLPFILVNIESSLNAVSYPVTVLGHGLQKSLNWFSSGVQITVSEYVNLISVKKNNQALLKEVSQLRMERVAYQEIKLENQRLLKMLEFKRKQSMDLLPAIVISQDALLESESVTLGKGISSGVKEGMGVLSLEGVTGLIRKPSLNSAQVLLLTDRFSVIEGLVQRSRERGIIEGNGGDLLEMRHLNSKLDIQIGDLIVTSGSSLEFPKGLPIGVVEEIKSYKAGITKTAFLRPLSRLKNSEELFVVLNSKNNNQDTVTSLNENQ